MPLMTSIRQSAGKVLPFLRVPPAFDRPTVSRLRPVRNGAVAWEIGEDGEAVLRVPRRKDRVGRFVGGWFRLPETRTVVLDEVGTFVWDLCDGENTVETIVKKLLVQYRLGRRETEVSVATYLQSLSERRLIMLYERRGRR